MARGSRETWAAGLVRVVTGLARETRLDEPDGQATAQDPDHLLYRPTLRASATSGELPSGSVPDWLTSRTRDVRHVRLRPEKADLRSPPDSDLRKLAVRNGQVFRRAANLPFEGSFPIWPRSTKFFAVECLWWKNLDVTYR
jgi:hypothetical protein